MDKYQAYLNSNKGEESLFNQLLEEVLNGDVKAVATAAQIKAIRDIKWELKKLDKDDN